MIHPYKIYFLRSDGTRMLELIYVLVVVSLAMLVSLVYNLLKLLA